jgi:hypothetical protein
MMISTERVFAASTSRLIPFAIVMALLHYSAIEVAAQPDLFLQFANGRVILRAENVSIRQILTRWAQVGQTTIINGDKVPDVKVTLHFDNVLERDALATLLRDVGGYILARRSENPGGVAWVDRILILPLAPLASVTTSQPSISVTRRPSLSTVFQETAVPVRAARAAVDPVQQETREADGLGNLNGGDPSQAVREVAGAVTPGEPLGLVSGPVGANLPISGAKDENDMSRYEGLVGANSQPTEEPGLMKVAPNPFGVTSGAATPGPPSPTSTTAPSGSAPAPVAGAKR